MNYGIGYFRLVKPTFVWIGDPANGYQSAPAVPAGTNPQYRYQSKDLGWEIDLGFTFQIYDNVAFETQFGYFFNGNAFETWDDGSKSWKDAKDTFAWGNAITFSF
jgi:hypothetical protein